MENKKSLSIPHFYKWGSGYISDHHKECFDDVVDTFVKRNNLQLTVECSEVWCAQVGDMEDGIYFHAMDTVFSGDYNKPELVDDFIYVMDAMGFPIQEK